MTQRLEDILQKAVDGEASPQETAELQAHLAKDPDARQRYEQLVELSRQLGAVESVEPPAQLRDEVLRSIRQETAPTRRGAASLKELWQRFWPRHAYSFAAGAAAALIFVAALGGNATAPLSETALMGMMVQDDVLEDFDLAAVETVDWDEAKGRIETRFSEGTVIVRLALESRNPVRTEVVFDDSALRPLSFQQAHDLPGTVEIAPTRVRVQHVGDNNYVIALRETDGEASSITVRLVSEDSRFERTLPTRSGTS